MFLDKQKSANEGRIIFLHFPVLFAVGWLSYAEPNFLSLLLYYLFTRRHTKSKVIRKKNLATVSL